MNAVATSSPKNPVGILGFEFVEFSTPNKQDLHKLFLDLGFSRLKKHASMDADYYRQGDIHFIVNCQPGSFATSFAKLHGPSVSATGWRVENAKQAFEAA